MDETTSSWVQKRKLFCHKICGIWIDLFRTSETCPDPAPEALDFWPLRSPGEFSHHVPTPGTIIVYREASCAWFPAFPWRCWTASQDVGRGKRIFIKIKNWKDREWKGTLPAVNLRLVVGHFWFINFEKSSQRAYVIISGEFGKLKCDLCRI